jgi:hypothetical protein
MDSIHLHGAEDVRSAGFAISRAAETICSAANTMSEAGDINTRAVQQLQYVLESFTRDMTGLVERIEKAMKSDQQIRSEEYAKPYIPSGARCECLENMGNEFYFLPVGKCLRKDGKCNAPRWK